VKLVVTCHFPAMCIYFVLSQTATVTHRALFQTHSVILSPELVNARYVNYSGIGDRSI